MNLLFLKEYNKGPAGYIDWSHFTLFLPPPPIFFKHFSGVFKKLNCSYFQFSNCGIQEYILNYIISIIFLNLEIHLRRHDINL